MPETATPTDIDKLVRREYVGQLIGHFTAHLAQMTTAEKAHSAGILANTFLTFNRTNGSERDAYAVAPEALTHVEQVTVGLLFEAAEWGEKFYGSAMRRISSNLKDAFDKV